mmetsp:Transcript_86112/g.200221  ORF Transcript_86112/g.200221 Transcript_86112/m.200221 type:complete len:222 (+) Transcript_86112:1184-1849(+)
MHHEIHTVIPRARLEDSLARRALLSLDGCVAEALHCHLVQVFQGVEERVLREEAHAPSVPKRFPQRSRHQGQIVNVFGLQPLLLSAAHTDLQVDGQSKLGFNTLLVEEFVQLHELLGSVFNAELVLCHHGRQSRDQRAPKQQAQEECGHGVEAFRRVLGDHFHRARCNLSDCPVQRSQVLVALSGLRVLLFAEPRVASVTFGIAPYENPTTARDMVEPQDQ